MIDKKWEIFLSLQGNNENTPEPSKDIVTSIEHLYERFVQFDVFNYFNLPMYKKILVIGAGSGGEVRCLIDKGYDVIGTSLHWSDKKFAKSNYNVDILIEDVHNMSFQSEIFDGIYSYHSLEHTLSPLIALFEIRRVLKPNGKLYIIVPKSGTDEETGLQHYSVLTEKLWEHLLDLVGFKDILVHSPGYTVMKAIRANDKECPGKHFEREFKIKGIY